MPSTGGGPSLFKWQLALGLGAVGAVGLAYWYMGSKRRAACQSLKELPEDEIVTEQTDFEKAQEFKAKGNDLFKRGKYDEAISMYNQAIEMIPEEYKTDLATYYQNRAAAYEHLKKWSSVIADCTKAIELNNKYEKALMRRAKAGEMIKDWENALDDITSVCILQNFQNQNALLMADRVLKELGKKNAAEAIKKRTPITPSKNFIRTYFSSFSEDPVFKKLLDMSEPIGEGDLRGFEKAKLAFATENFDDIIPACTEELNLSESESDYKLEALSLRASFYFLRGEFQEANDDLTTIINSKEASNEFVVNSLIKRSSIYMQTEKIPECLADFDMAATKGPNNSDVFHHRGQIKLLMERTEEARKDFERAVKINPDFSIAVVQKSYSDYRHAMLTQDVSLLLKSLEGFQKAMERFPNCAETYVLFAQVKTEKQEYEDAQALYKKALEIDPFNASIYVHQGLLLLQWKGDTEKAVELMKEGIKVDDRCEFAYETLGTIEVQRGNFLLAIDLFEKAIALARSELEMVHLFSLRDAAASQQKIALRLGLNSLLKNAA